MTRAAYYKWLNREIPVNELENQRIAEKIEEIHKESPDKGYRRIRDDLERYHDIYVNDKRVLRICRKKDIKSTIKYANNGCTRQAKNPQYLAENILNREFYADAPGLLMLQNSNITLEMKSIKYILVPFWICMIDESFLSLYVTEMIMLLYMILLTMQ